MASPAMKLKAPSARALWSALWPCLRGAALVSLAAYLVSAAVFGQSLDALRGSVNELRADSLGLAHRLGVIEALAIERRITSLEVKLDGVQDVGRAVLFGVAGLCVDTAIRLITAGVRLTRGRS